jgi:hypothetical protein
MSAKLHKVTAPVIVTVDEFGPRELSQRISVRADNECLLVIYPNPTLRQARIQLWISIKMFLGALCRGVSPYFRRVNRAHNMAYRNYMKNQLFC